MKIWKTTYQAAVGRDHYHNGLPCQDYVAVFRDEDVIVAAVSDGIGSLCNSHIASETAVHAVIDWVRQHKERLAQTEDSGDIERMLKTDLIGFIHLRMETAAEQYGVELDTMDCNLAFACVFSNGEAICGVIGDCAVCVVGEQSAVLTCPSDSANGTDTLLGSVASECMYVARFHPQSQQIKGFLLTTDGLEGVIYTKNSEVLRQRAAEYMNTILSHSPKEELQKLIRNLPSSCEDDISVAIVSQAREEITLPDDPTWLCRCGNRNTLDVSYCRYCRGDFVDMYKHAKISKDIPAWFLRLNRYPDEERKLLGLPIQYKNTIRQEEKTAADRINAGLPAGALEGDNSPFSGSTASAEKEFSKATQEKRGAKSSGKSLGGSSKKREPNWKNTPDNDYSDKLLIFFICATIVALLWNVKQSFTLGAQERRIEALESYIQEMNSAEQEPIEKVYAVSSNILYFWTEPNGEQIESVRKDSFVYVTVGSEQTVDGIEWVMGRAENGTTGWCRMDKLTAIEEEPTP